MLNIQFTPQLRRRLLAVAGGSLLLAAVAGAFIGLKIYAAKASAAIALPQMADNAVMTRVGAAGPMQVSMGTGRPGQATMPLRATKAAFDENCLRPIRLKRFGEAIEGCSRFTEMRERAGHAHAALAAIYATRSYSNPAASVMHAQLAAQAGDGRGKFMVAFHGLTGQSTQPFDLDRTRALLMEAKAAGVVKAQQYIDVIDASRSCREQAAFKLFDEPVFCLFRPELTQLLSTKGMTERQKDLERWIDVYRPGAVLASADRAEVAYDRDPQEELHRLARFTYVFNPQDGVDRVQLLRRVLSEKYGQPQAMDTLQQRGGHSEWRLPDGVAIALSKDADGNVQVTYSMPQRWDGRAEHLKRERELEQNAQLMREQIAL